MRKSYDGARSSETHRGDRKRPSLPEEVLRRSEKERPRAKNIYRFDRVCRLCVHTRVCRVCAVRKIIGEITATLSTSVSTTSLLFFAASRRRKATWLLAFVPLPGSHGSVPTRSCIVRRREIRRLWSVISRNVRGSVAVIEVVRVRVLAERKHQTRARPHVLLSTHVLFGQVRAACPRESFRYSGRMPDV